MLSDAQIERIERRLMQEREAAQETLARLETDLEARAEEYELSAVPSHPADRGSEVQEEDTDALIVDVQAERVAVIDEALQRLRDDPGSYDVSVVSGARIPFSRLQIIPWTRVLADEEDKG